MVYSAPAAGTSDADVEAAKQMSKLLYKGQPLGLIVAKSRREAEAASKAVTATYSFEGLAKGVYTIADALAAGNVPPPMVNERGDVNAEFAKPGMKVVEGSFTIGGQSHFCMEKHGALSIPEERGHIQIHCGSQAIDLVRQFAGAVLGKSGVEVEVIVRRMGGAFGAKFTKMFPVILGSAVAATKLEVPVKIVNSIEVDMVMSGHCRHPTEIKYKAAVDPATQKIAAIDWSAVLDKGCATDFSGFVAGEFLNHAECLYHVPNFRVSVTMVNTNTPSNTAVRGPGIPQAHAMGEQVVEHLALTIGADIEAFRKHNLLTEDATTMAVMETPEGQIAAGFKLSVVNYTVPRIWDELSKSSAIDARKVEIAKFNAANKFVKRGIALMPMRYSHMPGFNGGTTCTISIHGADGAVNVHHGGVEMGQGLNTKVAQAIALSLGCPLDAVYVHASSTTTTANPGIVGGSVGSETCVAAALKASKILIARMEPVKQLILTEKKAAAGDGDAGAEIAVTFAETVAKCSGGMGEGFKVCLAASANYRPKEGLPPGVEPVEPWEDAPYPQGMYLTFGAAVSETEVDVLTGDVRVLRTDILYDCGHSLNPLIDIGQAEGAFVFGQGFFLGEQIDMSPDGETLTKGTWEYKPTTALNMPREFHVEFLKDSPFQAGVKSSKAVGEPPLVAAYSLFNATKNAITASRIERGLSPCVNLNIPATCDTVFAALELSSADLIGSL